MSATLFILTGSSGSGKTTIALAIEQAHPEYTVFRFDTIGVPSSEVMAAFGTGHQPGGAWQRAMTLQWFARIAPVVAGGRPVLFEGQMRIAFILEALQLHPVPRARIVLVECDDATRNARLIHERRQPELANESMQGWSRYLHAEAIEAGLEILDTSKQSPAQSATHILRYLES